MSGDIAHNALDGSSADGGLGEPGAHAELAELTVLTRVSSSQPLSPIPDNVLPEIRDFAETLRVLFGALGMSLNRLAALLHSDPGTVSRYLSGKRIPPPDFIDSLCKVIYDVKGSLVTPQVQELVHDQFLVALRVHNPARYEVQRLTDLLVATAQERQQYEITVAALEEAIASRNDKIYALKLEGRQLRSHWARVEGLLEEERERLQQTMDSLNAEIVYLKEQLLSTQRRAAAAEERCRELEKQLDSAGALLQEEDHTLTEQLSAAALRTARLQQSTSMLAEALTIEQVVEVITEVGRTAIGALRSAVVLLDFETTRLRVINPDGLPVAGLDSAHARLTLDTPGVMTRAITTRRPVIIPSPEELRRQFEPDLAAWPGGGAIDATCDEESWVGLPLLAAGAPLGALRFSFSRPRRITEEERIFLEALAGQCAMAVERAEMYERERTAAVTLQRSLLPDRLPVVAGLGFDARYLPVTRDMEVGGDWYDVFRLPDSRLAVIVGDVTGKGLQAAAGMGRVRNALRSLALTDPRPVSVLSGLDRLFNATELDEQLTTVSYLVIDPETGEGQAGNAGHLPTLLLTPGALPILDQAEPDTPLGWPSFRKQHAFRLPPGSTAVLYSNGLVMNRVRGLDAGLDELVRAAASASEDLVRAPGGLLQYLLDNMLVGHEHHDDVTLLMVQHV